jgi:type IV secretory pathway TrbL component
MQPYILYFHSLIRYFILLFALIVVLQSLMGILGKQEFKKVNKTTALLLLIFCDLQLLLGIWLYFNWWNNGHVPGSPIMSDAYNRFWAVEHTVGMIVAIILVHVGYSFAKKVMNDDLKFKRLFWCSFAALAIFMAMIPWASKKVVGRSNVPHLQA